MGFRFSLRTPYSRSNPDSQQEFQFSTLAFRPSAGIPNCSASSSRVSARWVSISSVQTPVGLSRKPGIQFSRLFTGTGFALYFVKQSLSKILKNRPGSSASSRRRSERSHDSMGISSFMKRSPFSSRAMNGQRVIIIGAASMSCMVFAWFIGLITAPAAIAISMPSPVRSNCLRLNLVTSGDQRSTKLSLF